MRNAEWIRDMGKYDLKARTKAFALRIIKLVEALPSGKTTEFRIPHSAFRIPLIS